MAKKDESRTYRRFPISYRVEHILLIASFTTLAVTGLIQKFSTGWFSEWLVGTLGGVENVRIVHRTAAMMMALESIYHLAVVGYRVFVLRNRLTMLPGIEDARAALEALMYNLGLRKSRPLEGRYTFVEKAEYWALVWGTLVMGISGFMLWNPIATARILPGEIIPAAKAAHGAEAVLAAAAIVVWHFYHAHVKFFNKSMFTGKLTEEEMVHEHPLELAAIKAGTAERVIAAERIARRRRLYISASAVTSILLVVGLIYFMTFEETAIATVPPPEDVTVFVPLTPTLFPTAFPTATPMPMAALTWEDGVAALFQDKCAMCHSVDNAMGGLVATSYQALLTGGESGPGIVPGDASTGTVLARQATGDHAGQFSTDELTLVREWIAAGAPAAQGADTCTDCQDTAISDQTGLAPSRSDEDTSALLSVSSLVHYPARCSTCHHVSDCTTCHVVPDDHHSTRCASCHNTEDWQDVAAHHEALGSCQTCHAAPHDPYPRECSDCHTTDGWAIAFLSHSGFADCTTCHAALPSHYHGECANCHNPSAWDLVAFDHTGFDDCLGCHSAQRPTDHYLSLCTACHNTVQWSQVAVDHTQLPNCESCHLPPAGGHWSGQCSLCHSTGGWAGASYAHTGTESCSSCHLVPAGHWLGACSSCHTTDTWEDASFVHTGLEVCSGCHVAPEGHWSGECSNCHNTASWSDVDFDHTNYTDCLACHSDDRPDNHPWAQCSQCHTTEGWDELNPTPTPPATLVPTPTPSDTLPSPTPTATPPGRPPFPTPTPGAMIAPLQPAVSFDRVVAQMVLNASMATVG